MAVSENKVNGKDGIAMGLWKRFDDLLKRPDTPREIDEKIALSLAEYRNRPWIFCKDCIHICKPTGAPYVPHPESLCLAGGTINYVTGETEHWLCKYQNSEGHCPLFEPKEGL